MSDLRRAVDRLLESATPCARDYRPSLYLPKDELSWTRSDGEECRFMARSGWDECVVNGRTAWAEYMIDKNRSHFPDLYSSL